PAPPTRCDRGSRWGRLFASPARIYNRKSMRSVATLYSLAVLLLLAVRPGAVAGPGAKQKYYFNISEIRAAAATDDATKTVAREALQSDLAARPEFTSDLGGVTGEEAIVAELKRRNLQGFQVTLKIEQLSREKKASRPGSRYPQ